MNRDTGQVTIEVYLGAVIIRSAGKVVGRFDRNETGTATVNLGDHPDAETPDAEEWTSFEPVPSFLNGKPVDLPPHITTWRNNLYTVHRTMPAEGGGYLSIRSNDRHWRHDWRHLQRIKNELLGTDVEAVELYPAVSRLVDDANQWHLWALPAGEQFPFGFSESDQDDNALAGGWKQRPTREGDVVDHAQQSARRR
jgi:hypothetical protein